jgi:hypothetical protein
MASCHEEDKLAPWLVSSETKEALKFRFLT